jgi:hypothetical protein
MGKPDFVIAGAQKCGTTFLSFALQKHSEIYLRPLEVHFFDKHFDKGVEWYEGLFVSDKICGDKTPRYALRDEWVQRLYDVLPNAKLIFIMRNPVDRAYSQYQHYARKGWMKGMSFEEAWETNAEDPCSMVNRGLYLQQLQRLLKYYDRSDIHLMVTEELEADWLGELSKLCNFLGAGDYHYDMEFKRTDYEPMSNKTREELIAFYKPYNEGLFDFLGKRISKWEV